jgi:hypothetical protein
MSECSICIETFNKVQRKKIMCPYCVTEMCRSCVSTWVKEHPMTPRCPVPTCQAGWSEDFLSDSLTKTFLLKEFKAAKEVVLLDMEKARLPESQERARRYKDAKVLVDAVNAKINPIKVQIEAMPEKIAHMANKKAYHTADMMYWQGQYNRWTGAYEGKEIEYAANRTRTRYTYEVSGDVYRKAAEPFKKRLEALRTRGYRDASYLVETYGVPRAVGGAGAPAPAAKSQWTFVMKCPKTGCEGFVGNDWACGLCALEVCKDCHEPTAKGHVCNPDTKLSVAAMAKEAKPCPKCAASISKIDGCDQMWCTQCHTAFSWRTGAVEERVHNPHYYEWMRRNGGMPATGGPPGGAPPEGGCLANNEVIPQVQHHYWNDHVIQQACRAILHGEGLLRQHRAMDRMLNEEDTRALLRVKRLVSEITEDAWKDKLQRMDKAKKKNTCMLAVLDMYVQAGTDLMRTALPADADRDAIAKQVSELRKYCNDELEKVHKRYNCEVPLLT